MTRANRFFVTWEGLEGKGKGEELNPYARDTTFKNTTNQ